MIHENLNGSFPLSKQIHLAFRDGWIFKFKIGTTLKPANLMEDLVMHMNKLFLMPCLF